MTYSIAELRSRNPMWYFERNYVLLMKLLDAYTVLEDGAAEYELPDSRVIVSVLEETKYTYLLEIRQQFQQSNVLFRDLEFKVRIYMDASLAEVVSYQGAHYLKARYQVPNVSMFHPDEKRQSNLLLFDWLSVCSRLNFSESGITNYQ